MQKIMQLQYTIKANIIKTDLIQILLKIKLNCANDTELKITQPTFLKPYIYGSLYQELADDAGGTDDSGVSFGVPASKEFDW